MFKNAKIGDKLYSMEDGWGVLEDITDRDHPLTIQFDSYKKSFTLDGRRYIDSKNQTLFWDKIEFEIPKRPLPNLKVDAKVLVWGSSNKDRKVKRYFKEFNVNGELVCFRGGATSWSTDGVCCGWKYWELVE